MNKECEERRTQVGFEDVLAQAPSWQDDDQNSSSFEIRNGLDSSKLLATDDGQTGNDEGLRLRVVASLLSGGISVGDRRLQVTVRDSSVILRGYAAAKREQQLAIHLILLVSDVRKVIDHSKVGEPPIEYIEPVRSWKEWLGNHQKHVVATLAMSLFVGVASFWWRDRDAMPLYPVAGEVRVEGKIPPGAFVVLHPISKALTGDSLPRGVVGSDGVFRIGTFSSSDGAPVGEYTVTVEWRPLVGQGEEVIPGPNVIPAKYGKPETSALRVRVTRGKNRIKLIELSTSQRVLTS